MRLMGNVIEKLPSV